MKRVSKVVCGAGKELQLIVLNHLQVQLSFLFLRLMQFFYPPKKQKTKTKKRSNLLEIIYVSVSNTLGHLLSNWWIGYLIEDDNIY